MDCHQLQKPYYSINNHQIHKHLNMFKFVIVIFALIACAAAKPGNVAPLAYSSPFIAGPGVVTAASSQVVARTYNGIATAPIAAPFASRYVASPYAAAPLVSGPFAAPLAAAPLAGRVIASPYAVPLTAPFAARYAAASLIAGASPYAYSPFAAPLAYSAGLRYAAASAPIVL